MNREGKNYLTALLLVLTAVAASQIRKLAAGAVVESN